MMGMRERRLFALLLALALVAPAVVTPTPVAAAGDPAPCTNWKSLISPPKTIRVLRTRTGLVEVVPFRTYVYRTHVAEFWSEYLPTPYSNALLGAGAVAIKQNAWSWTMNPRNWWGLTSFTEEQASWVRADYADDNQLNGSDGNPDWSNQKRASEHATIALDMRIRLGADLKDDGVGGLKWNDATSTWTAPLEVLDDNGDPIKPTKSSKRSCFDVVDHPSMNQFYTRGGIHEPGYDDGTKSNARYNAAVDATWGITMQRFYPIDSTWRFWRPGFYGSFTVTRECMDPPEPGDLSVQMRHPSQPSHYRGWSFFPVNADDCARSRNLTVEALLRESFYSWEGDMVEGSGTASVADDRYDITAVYPIRVLSPHGDLTGDARGDLAVFSPAGSMRIVSSDANVGSTGLLKGKSVGSVKLTSGQTLVDRIVARTMSDGGAAVADLRRNSDGTLTVVETPLVAGVLKSARERLADTSMFDPTATLSLLAIDTSNDGIEELFISERVPSATTPESSTLRLWQLALPADDGAVEDPTKIIEVAAGADARFMLGDVTADGVPDLITLWRGADGSLMLSMGQGSGEPPIAAWSPSELSAPGAVLWPVRTGWTAALGDLNGDGYDELYVRNTDAAGRSRIHAISLIEADDGTVANVERPFAPEVKPAETTKVLAGEGNISLIAKRLKVTAASLIALNSGPTYAVTIQPNDTYTKIATRIGASEACLRLMNGNKVLVRGKTLTAPYDRCVIRAKSVLFRNAPVRIAAGEFDWLRAGDDWAKVASRAVALGIAATADSIAALNPGVSIDTAAAGTKVRIRLAWAAPVRSAEPPGATEIGGKILSWSEPFTAWTAPVGAAVPSLYVRDWNGDAIDDLLVGPRPGVAGLSLRLMKLTEGKFTTAATVSRTFAITGWILR
jgi:hypothetical protein